ncbi:hypothetical protein AQUCO_02200169v1 [Aquilegia coerulea]|uniref:Protein kinase domain-containing protein n=1 Tax=Aquilegia coerulea TaxID=218851 RepID=A0A2G5DE88_AQUCA|nr:hypothetical protein AQUCO_02200169v1 [Aquilegia coerulea]
MLFIFLHKTHSQQTYVNNKQLNCDQNDTSTSGYLCTQQTSCQSYLTFRAQTLYDSAATIGLLLNSDPSMIAQLNNITDVDKIPTNTLIIVPITNCSCSGNFFQYNTTYQLRYATETYFSLANNTYQGLTTCQALINQNPQYGVRNLVVGLRLSVPLRCACPSRNQTSDGVKFLLSYLVTWGDSIDSISDSFGVDQQSILDANQLSSYDLIFPFTPLLIPLTTQPTYNPNAKPPPESQPPTISTSPTDDNSNSNNSSSSSSKTWVFVGIGIGLFLLVLVLFGFWFLCFRGKGRGHGQGRSSQPILQGKEFSVSTDNQTTPEKNSQAFSVSSENVRILLDSSFNVYTFEELQTATNQFSEENRIKASVYRGVIKGDNAAIKRMKGNALNEINILKQINHSNVVRLSGYCMHEGNTYLVYEFMENGSLSDWLHEDMTCETPVAQLGWKQRVQIAYDVADGLNYLHNYANPAYVHKDLKSSNILLNGDLRAKIANFGMARAVENKEGEEEEEGLQLTRHVVGTQGYMAPEYIENGVVTPKLDVFAFGVVMLELLSGKEATTSFNFIGNDGKTVKGEMLLFVSINQVLEGENVREKLKNFIDPSLASEYPLELAFSMAQLAKICVAYDLSSRPTMFDVFVSLSKILSSSLDWDP